MEPWQEEPRNQAGGRRLRRENEQRQTHSRHPRPCGQTSGTVLSPRCQATKNTRGRRQMQKLSGSLKGRPLNTYWAGAVSGKARRQAKKGEQRPCWPRRVRSWTGRALGPQTPDAALPEHRRAPRPQCSHTYAHAGRQRDSGSPRESRRLGAQRGGADGIGCVPHAGAGLCVHREFRWLRKAAFKPTFHFTAC